MFTPTPEQQEVKDYVLEQVRAGAMGNNVIISGQGGVGKTSLICDIIRELLEENFSVAVGAMTGKATAVLRGKIYAAIGDRVKTKLYLESGQLKIETLQKLTKVARVVGVSNTGTTTYSNKWIDPSSFKFDVLVIDELSMVPSYISSWWQNTSARVIGLGDFCQLPEVNSKDSLSKELDSMARDIHIKPSNVVSGYGIKVLKSLSQCQLTKVLRSENEIAFLCNDLRDFSKTPAQIVKTMKEWADKAHDSITYSESISELKTDDDWQIICYTNKKCQAINNALCKGGEDYPFEDDKILLFDNIPPLQLYNGDVVKFSTLLNRIKEYNSKMKNLSRQITVVLKWRNQMPSSTSKYAIERQMAHLFKSFKIINAEAQRKRLAKVPEIIKDSGWAESQVEEWVKDVKGITRNTADPEEAFTKVIQKFSTSDQEMATKIIEEAGDVPRMYVVNIDYGYAITTHKSQGSEFPKVCYLLEKFDKPLLYTGVSRAKEELFIINLTSVR